MESISLLLGEALSPYQVSLSASGARGECRVTLKNAVGVTVVEREFNQAERLAAPLAHALGVPLRTDLVRRREATSSQTSLSRKDRIGNMRTAFEPARPPQIHGSWILVDDVLTTGATTDAVAAVLKNLGAEHVVVWAVAQAILEIDLLPARQS